MTKDELIRTLTPHMTVRKYEAGAVIASDLAKSRTIFYLKTGVALAEAMREEVGTGSLKQVSLLKPIGSMVGVESVFTEVRGTVPMTLRALYKCKVGVLEAARLTQILRTDLKELKAEIAEGLAEVLAESYRDLLQDTERWVLAPAESRVLHVFETLGRASMKPHPRGKIVDISTAQMARIIGQSEESARRGIKSLMNSGRALSLTPRSYVIF